MDVKALNKVPERTVMDRINRVKFLPKFSAIEFLSETSTASEMARNVPDDARTFLIRRHTTRCHDSHQLSPAPVMTLFVSVLVVPSEPTIPMA